MERKPTILVADDSSTVRTVAQMTLDAEFEVCAVKDGEQALHELQTLRPDLVIADTAMPKKDGYEVCAFIRSQPDLKHIPVLLLSGAFDPFDAARAAEVGSDGHVVKPFEPRALIAKMKHLVAAAAPRS